MAVRFRNGFEHGSLFGLLTRGSPSITTSQYRSGLRSAYLSTNNTGIGKVISDDPSEVFVGVGYHVISSSIDYSNSIISLLSSSGVPTTFLGFTDGSRALKLIRRTGILSGNYVVVATGPELALNTWYYLEFRLRVSATTGVAQVWVNGNLTLEYAGDTKGGSAAANVQRVWLGKPTMDGATQQVPWNGIPGYVDDWKINDTAGEQNNDRVGLAGIVGKRPNASGIYSQFTPLGAGFNFEEVDEVPADDDTSYVYSDVLGAIDTYSLEAITELGGDVGLKCVTLYLRSKLETAGGNDDGIKRVLRMGGVNYKGTNFGLGTDYSYLVETLLEAPDGEPWTVNKFNTIQLGFENSDAG